MQDGEQSNREGLSPEEQDYLLGRNSAPSRIERRRPAWLVIGMVWATLGIYMIIWSGLHWAEMKRQLKDDRMYPIWHALAMIVPVYSFFRFHANFRVLNELLATTRSTHRVRPLVAIGTFLLASLLVAVPIEDTLLLTLNLVAAMGAISWIIYHGQMGMNAYWETLPERRWTDRVHLWERIVIALAAGFWLLLLFGALALVLE